MCTYAKKERGQARGREREKVYIYTFDDSCVRVLSSSLEGEDDDCVVLTIIIIIVFLPKDFVDFVHSYVSPCPSFEHSSWGQSLLAIIRQHAQHQGTADFTIDSADQHSLALAADQAAHARACAK